MEPPKGATPPDRPPSIPETDKGSALREDSEKAYRTALRKILGKTATKSKRRKLRSVDRKSIRASGVASSDKSLWIIRIIKLILEKLGITFPTKQGAEVSRADSQVGMELHATRETGFESVDTIRKAMVATLTKIVHLDNEIQDIHVSHQKEMLALYQRTFNVCESYPNVVEDKLTELKDLSFRRRQETEQALAAKYKEMEQKLYDLAARKNEIPPKLSTTKSFEELKALQKLDREFADQIHGLQQKQKALALSTNSRSIVDNRVVLFQSVIERKLSLLKEKYTLESNPERTEKEEKQLASINKQLEKVPAKKRKTLEKKRDKLLKKIKSKKDPKKEIESLEKILPKLAQPPTKETIDTLKKEIELELDSLPKNLSVTDARLQYLGTPYLNLRWGEKFVNIALTNPANWLTKYEVGIRFSRNGKAHVQVTKVEPQNIHKEGGVPARLRNDPGYNTRPANVNKTTSYILSDRDTHGKEHVSFRIGQFPTMKAAKEALKTMMRENPGKLTDYHDNTLLTPTMFPDRPDRKLIRQHHENVKAALASLLQDVKTTSALKDSIDTLSILESIDADVRKEDLQQHKDLFSDDPEIRDAVTVDTLRSILEKRLQEKQVLDGKGNPYTEKDVQQIIDKCTMSNFGVNEGAVGKMHGLRLGWHTSMGEYNNEATRKLSRVLKEKLTTIESKVQTGEALTEEEKGILDRLGGIVQVGQEFEAVWAKNDYMNADVGNNQVKAPALWRALDSLLNITVNTHCMSAKDRASIVESNAIEYLAEIEMSLADHKKELAQVIDRWEKTHPVIRLPEELKEELIHGSFKVEDVQGLFEKWIPGQDLKTLIRQKKMEKLQAARKALGLANGEGFIQKKTGVQRLRGIKAQGWFISSNKPLREKHPTEAFPQLSLPSVYIHTGKIDLLDPSDEEVKVMEERHRMHQNRRQGVMMADLVTKENTGVPGSKLKGGRALKRFYSGFDTDYVLYRLLHARDTKEFESLFHSLLGTSQIDDKSRRDLLTQAMGNFDLESGKDKVKEWKKVIKEVEEIKFESHRPLKKVKS